MAKIAARKKNKYSVIYTSTNPKRPFVSVCTPTSNRRQFIPHLIKCFQMQSYPHEKMEWIVVDDGEDSVEDLFKNVPRVKYHRLDEKLKIGKKRNLMHSLAKGDIYVYFDDDDYYPPERVKHAVTTLLKNPRALCAGSSEMYIYFKDRDEIWKFGPYGPLHATAATFAFWKKLLKFTRYDDEVDHGEEKIFLKNYTIPMVQLNSFKTILVFSHGYNTYDKRKLIEHPKSKYVKKTTLHVSDFISDKSLADFYKDI